MAWFQNFGTLHISGTFEARNFKFCTDEKMQRSQAFVKESRDLLFLIFGPFRYFENV